ncbi:Uma2 family endonuclease [bacterium]|nr:Uma2 family endonuclease [bacterium]
MESPEQYKAVSIGDYLAAELESEIKHEYLGGVLYAMSGARNRHNRIVMNIYGLLWSRLRGRACQPYNSDTKIRIRLPNHVRFYYPDASVICRSNPLDDSFQDEPVVIVEVLSKRTRRLDEGEKKDAYLTISSLMVYLLVEQDSQAVQAFRRTDQGFARELYADGVIGLPEIDCELPLADLYHGIE